MITTKVQTGPVILTYKNDAAPDEMIEGISEVTPTTEVIDHNDVKHQIWQISDQNTIDQITNLVDEIGMLYIADGHHRCAASVRAGYISLLGGPDVPIDERFFLGGRTTLRGFAEVLRCEMKPKGIRITASYPPDTDTPQLTFEDQYKPDETRAIAGNAAELNPAAPGPDRPAPPIEGKDRDL